MAGIDIVLLTVMVMHGGDSNDSGGGDYEKTKGAKAWTSSSFLFCTACMKREGNQIHDDVKEEDDRG